MVNSKRTKSPNSIRLSQSPPWLASNVIKKYKGKVSRGWRTDPLCVRWKWNHWNITPLCQNLKAEGGATESNDWSHVRIFGVRCRPRGLRFAPGSGLIAPSGPLGFAIALIKKSSRSDARVCFLMAWCFGRRVRTRTDAKVHVNVNMRPEIKCARWFRLCHLVVVYRRTLSSLLFPPSGYVDYDTRPDRPGGQQTLRGGLALLSAVCLSAAVKRCEQ